MSQEKNATIFKPLYELLGIEENFAEDISSETFYAFVIAYNDLIMGKKREVEKNKSGQNVYKLFDKEKAGLTLAFKAGISGNVSEEDVKKQLEDTLSPDVNTILSSKNSYAKKLDQLHSVAVEKQAAKSSAGSYKKYNNLIERGGKLGTKQMKNDYKNECDMIELVGSLLSDSQKLKQYMKQYMKDGGDVAETKKNIEELGESAIERMFYFIRQSTTYAVGGDSYLKCIREKEQLESLSSQTA